MLRRRSNGVAEKSLHMRGQAMDFAIPGVALDKLRAAGLRLQRGGVGFYPTSGSPFVHMDVGGVRHWPRMTREQLVRVFPNGRTVHIPSDGKPLAGYALALADVEQHGGSLGSVSASAGREAGIDTEVAADTTASTAPRRSLLARIFGPSEPGQADETKSPSASPPVRVAAAPVKMIPVPLPKARPADAPIAVALALPVAKSPVNAKAAALAAQARAEAPPAVASLSPNEVIRARGYWTGVPDMNPVATTASAGQALAYAQVPVRRVVASQTLRPTVLMRSPATATSIAIKGNGGPAVHPVPASDPWLNAVTITPSVWSYLSSTQYGVRDPRSLQPLLDKPGAAIAMAFSGDPHHGLSAERFSGRAVVFLGTVAFAANGGDPTRTASLY
jgi:hypothetical protein